MYTVQHSVYRQASRRLVVQARRRFLLSKHKLQRELFHHLIYWHAAYLYSSLSLSLPLLECFFQAIPSWHLYYVLLAAHHDSQGRFQGLEEDIRSTCEKRMAAGVRISSSITNSVS